MHSRLPNLITLFGHLLSLAWLLCGAPWWVGGLGLLCDAADGWTARQLGATSAFGSLYDWTVDVTVGALLWVRLTAGCPHGALLLAAIVPVQVAYRLRGLHVSGRAALTVLALAVELAGGSP